MPYKVNRAFVNEIQEQPDWAPVILDDMSLAYQIGVDNRVLWYMAVNSKRPPQEFIDGVLQTSGRNPFYRRMEIPKPNGKVRVVHSVSKMLPKRCSAHLVLKALSGLIFGHVPWPEYVDAYVPGKSIVDSAEKHAGHKTAICFDIRDFFPSVTRGMIRRALQAKFGYNRYMAGLIASLVTLEKKLPQGSPIAPEVANLVGWHSFDEKIVAGISGPNCKWVYSRYSDDLILSHPDDVSDAEVEMIKTLVFVSVRSAGFWINGDKIRVYGWGEGRRKKMKWLGMVINQKTNADKHTYRRLRQLLHHAANTGFIAQAEYHGENPTKFKKKVQGMLSHLGQILEEGRVENLWENFRLAESRDLLREYEEKDGE